MSDTMSDHPPTQQPLRIGYVPEHFSVPLLFASSHHFGLDACLLVPFPSGTGHMISAIRDGAIDLAVGLTEAWIAGLGKEDVPGDGGYRLVGTYVTSPLCWAISTGSSSELHTVDSLKGSRIGVSRPGSGSHIMGYVLADQQGWLSPDPDSTPGIRTSPPFSDVVTLNDFKSLRHGVNSDLADFFMWEHFTTRAHDRAISEKEGGKEGSSNLRRLGEIYTPWSSWKIVASTRILNVDNDAGARNGEMRTRITRLLAALDRGIARFKADPAEVTDICVHQLNYGVEDVQQWLRTVQFPDSTQRVDLDVVRSCVQTLQKAGILVKGKGMQPEDMIVNLQC